MCCPRNFRFPKLKAPTLYSRGLIATQTVRVTPSLGQGATGQWKRPSYQILTLKTEITPADQTANMLILLELPNAMIGEKILFAKVDRQSDRMHSTGI